MLPGGPLDQHLLQDCYRHRGSPPPHRDSENLRHLGIRPTALRFPVVGENSENPYPLPNAEGDFGSLERRPYDSQSTEFEQLGFNDWCVPKAEIPRIVAPTQARLVAPSAPPPEFRDVLPLAVGVRSLGLWAVNGEWYRPCPSGHRMGLQLDFVVSCLHAGNGVEEVGELENIGSKFRESLPPSSMTAEWPSTTNRRIQRFREFCPHTEGSPFGGRDELPHHVTAGHRIVADNCNPRSGRYHPIISAQQGVEVPPLQNQPKSPAARFT